MTLAVLHISDIHFRDNNNPSVSRVKLIASAVKGSLPFATHCLVLLSGDIAFSGKASEYAIAAQFIRVLVNELTALGLQVHSAAVPGNHDCNFEKASSVRELVISNLPSSVDGATLDEEALNACLSVQDNFFTFTQEIGLPTPDSVRARLFHTTGLTIDGQQIHIRCYNTAWCSRLSESAGQLFFPTNGLPSATEADDSTVAVTVFHHPYGWLDPDNRRQFQRHIESTSDVVLTGHEHVQDYYRLERATGQQVQYL